MDFRDTMLCGESWFEVSQSDQEIASWFGSFRP
jgi:hypothetical protein